MNNYRRAIGTTTENNVKCYETFALKKLLSLDAVIFLSLLRYLVSKKCDSSIISTCTGERTIIDRLTLCQIHNIEFTSNFSTNPTKQLSLRKPAFHK